MLNETKDEFLKNCTDGKFYNSSITTYKRKIEVFFEFLEVEYGVNDENYLSILRGIDDKTIASSIKFYVRKYNISVRGTIDLYIAVLNKYFEFLNNKLQIENIYFLNKKKRSEIKETVEQTIKILNLEKSKKPKYPITIESFTEVLNECNLILNSFDILQIEAYLSEEQMIKNKNPIDEFISALIIKVVMFTGVKNNVIERIRVSDYDLKLNILEINSFSLHLPNELGIQMQKYLLLREKIGRNNNLELFLNKEGFSVGNKYSSIFKVLKSTIGSHSGESIAKYTIIEMLKKGINFSLIQSLTGFGMDTCLHCQDIVNDEKSNLDLMAQTRYMDSKLRSMRLYDLL